MVAEVTEELKHKMEVQEEHIVEVLVPMRNWCDSPNYGCKHCHMLNRSIGFYSPMRNWCDSPNYGCKHYQMVNSSIGFYSPSWTCKL